MKTIKVSTICPKWDWIRQTPYDDGIWQDFLFIFDKSIKTCDFWIVYENLTEQETYFCYPQNTILITGEPPSVKSYHPKFLEQFATVITCHKKIKHSNVILSHSSLPWMVGYQPPSTTFGKSYSELVKIKKINKTKLLSVICSNKTFTRGHKNRLNFVKKLAEHFGDTDFFGRDFRSVTDKWDAIAPYKYHIVIENSSFDHYWTEKLSDVYLAQSYPFYYGCQNIHEYFSKESFTKIDISQPEKAFEIIEKTIKNNQYEKSIESLDQAKDLVLNKYNFFPRITNYFRFCGQIFI